MDFIASYLPQIVVGGALVSLGYHIYRQPDTQEVDETVQSAIQSNATVVPDTAPQEEPYQAAVSTKLNNVSQAKQVVQKQEAARARQQFKDNASAQKVASGLIRRQLRLPQPEIITAAAPKPVTEEDDYYRQYGTVGSGPYEESLSRQRGSATETVLLQ